MLFNSYEFLFYFLPATLLAFHVLRRYSFTAALASLALASFIFYSWWNPWYAPLFVASILVNYGLGHAIARYRPTRWPLVLGILANLAVIGWYKYAGFFCEIAAGPEAVPDVLRDLVLPLAISFYTFQQVAYLVDVWRGDIREGSFLKYSFFVIFFPQLIAGPIVRFQEIEGQVDRLRGKRRVYQSAFIVGLFFFAIGLFKKVVLADHIALYANTIFNYVEANGVISSSDAWIGALSYSLQLYFDFSGYSDMAVGLGRMFGIVLPMNFFSPYKATSIADFWRRWHITLSRFFQDYLYIPLGGNRKGPIRHAINLVIVMGVVGLWHGAGMTFVAWGFFHGGLLLINHLWTRQVPKIETPAWWSFSWSMTSRCATLVAIICGWVLFRAESFSSASVMLSAMFGIKDGYSNALLVTEGYRAFAIPLIVVLSLIALLAPNSTQYVGSIRHLDRSVRKLRDARVLSFNRLFSRRASWANAAVLGCMLYLAVTAIRSLTTEFLYFNF